ncbi:hypothetical protein SAMN02745181_0285 [Rubritalea squalenifaciens DSM 18772]|uniref:Uncharacterized protein n=1 Tax=Rubritalea squalenifaciens DSM 18772 TaxID=1123071 RepID=A0A1M6BQK7_9BACT|nr:hypothetical protein [Rubritalea squalenifaciens]SHI51035.1 hypothetical protein SAMN02745181_0285 [Rubritalea squalenifaciens DSM 18772]
MKSQLARFHPARIREIRAIRGKESFIKQDFILPAFSSTLPAGVPSNQPFCHFRIFCGKIRFIMLPNDS